MPKFTVTVNDNGIRKRVVLESATEPTEAEVLSALREDYSFLSDSDLRAFKKGDYSSISDKGLLALKVKQTSTQSTNQTDYKKTSGTNRVEVRKYIITDPETGRKIQLTRDTLPTEQEIEEIFKNLPPPKRKNGETDAGLTQEITFVPDKIQQSNPHEFDPSKPFWLVSTPHGFKELINEPAKGLILFSPSGRRFQWTNSAALTQTDIEQLGRLETEQADLIKNSPEIRSLFNRTPNGLYLSGWITSLLAAVSISWILARRRYRRQSEGIKTTIKETESNPASFRRASLGVRRLASTLFWLFTLGCILMGMAIGGSDFRFLASAGPIMGLFSWVLIRGIDWIVRGFKFGGYDIDGNR